MVLFVFVLFTLTVCTAKSREPSAETPAVGEKTGTALSDPGTVLNDPKWGKVVDRDTIPVLPVEKGWPVFVREVFPSHEFHLPGKYFISGNDIYHVQIPTARDTGIRSYQTLYDISILEFGDSLIKMRGFGDDVLVETYGSMMQSEWEQVIKVFGSGGYDGSWSTRGGNYTLLYYNDELIQMENASGNVIKRVTIETGHSSLFKRTFVFDNGYILFSSINDVVDEPEMPGEVVFRIYNENLDYIDFDGSDDSLGNALPLTDGYDPLCYPVYIDNKAGIYVSYYGYGGNLYIAAYFFDFAGHEVIRIKPRCISKLERRVLDEMGTFSLEYDWVVNISLAQNLFWFPEDTSDDKRHPHSGILRRFPEVYPVYNPDLFLKAFNPEKYGEITPPPKEKESGTFSYTDDNYNIDRSMYPEFFYSYDRGILVQDSTSTRHFGTELDKGLADNLVTTVVSANTFLTEGGAEYRGENMREFSNAPWAVRKTGIDVAEIEVKIGGMANWLVIGNGFYHAEKPDLYQKNSRPKEIRITYGSGAQMGEDAWEHRVLLDDTFEMQVVPLLYAGTDARDISIKIVSVYPGTAYDDVCVNYIGAIGPPR
jgi:hypothetical protein